MKKIQEKGRKQRWEELAASICRVNESDPRHNSLCCNNSSLDVALGWGGVGWGGGALSSFSAYGLDSKSINK